ncbi:AAA family ATPase [Desulfobacula phenolica]|uniref:AAA domain-containing protein, putative AbiEii toxin, Type IV TA system n=1 Tax=Desulfobacula phenolica TaxID=90732 RepID=A0A1H2I320_9BACT|nr:AAA family ATPase [Desulfobacula phenolica]SDU38531.1 AAA domain-containing protein, putative AbiEii toxin, Type IV TA system [Desulfobacula phenolica]
MISQISFKNYKAFKNGEIKIKPITILLGANSVGKSSVVQLLLMLQQTALSNKYKSALKLHGEFVSLGENENIFNKKNTENDLEISFDFKDSNLFNLITKELYNDLETSLTMRLDIFRSILKHYSRNKPDNDLFENAIIPTKSKNFKSKDEFLQQVEKLSKLAKYVEQNEIIINDDDDDDEDNFILSPHFRRFLLPEAENIDDLYKSNLGDSYELFQRLQKIKNKEFNISFRIKNIYSKKNNVLKISSVKISNDNKCIFDLKFEINKAKAQYTNVIIKSDFLDNDKFFFTSKKKDFLKKIQYDSTLFYLFLPSDNEVDFPEFVVNESFIPSISSIINSIFSSALFTLRRNFKKEMINYVSPLRAHPKRYYFLDKAKINTFLDTLDGNSLTEILKENDLVKSKVNNWLERFNLSVNVSTLEDVIHKLKIKQNDLSLDITDVGFGISQVLPVIVQGFLSYQKSLTIIEQPEIHLHPKMQADLADLFIDIIYTDNKQNPSKFLIIETHSEYLLKRLRRRMAEKKRVKTSDVAIYFFDPKSQDDNGCCIEEREISKEGAFEWPKNFYSGELLQDTIEFIKHQGY